MRAFSCDDLVQALKDESVAAAIGAIFEKKNSEMFVAMKKLKDANIKLQKDCNTLKQDNNSLRREL